jgi:hypothetical protein
MAHEVGHIDAPAIRSMAQQIEDLKNQTKATAQAKVDALVEKAPEEEKLTLAQDLMAKMTPFAGWVTGKATDAFENLSEDEFVNSVVDETMRNLGLTARAGAEGAASLIGIVYDPLKEIVNLGSKIAGGKGDIPSYRAQISSILDNLGLPEPETTAERISGAITSGMSAGGGSVVVAKNLAKVLTGLSQKVSQIMATAPTAQVVGSGTGAGSGQTTAELGYNPVVQLGASLVGGLAGGRAANVKATPISQTVKNTVKDAETAGVPVLTSDARPPTTFAGKWLQKTTESIPILGTGGVRSAQQDLRAEAVQNLARSFGVNLGDDVDTISAVTQDLLRRRGSQLKQYTGLKSSVIESEQLRNAGSVNVIRAVSAIDEQIAILSRLRSDQVGPIIERLRDWRGALLGEKTVKGPNGRNIVVQEGQSLENIELLRKQIGQSFESADLASVKQLGQKSLNLIYGPLKEDMRTFIQKFGNRNDVKKFDTANTRLSEMAGELDNSLFKRVLSKGEVTPETISSMLFSKKPSDVKLLFKNLDAAGQANARTAIITKMFKDSVNANGGVSPDVFKNQIKKMSEQLGIFFNERDFQSVEGLGRILALTQRASQANLLPPTGAMLQIPVIGGLLTQTFGGVGAGVVAAGSLGALARIIESPAVRNILIKLPKIKSGSPQEAELLKRLDDIIIKESSMEREGDQIDDVNSSESPALQSLLQAMTPAQRAKIQQAVP